MDDFLSRRPMPFHLWIRKAAYERLLSSPRPPETGQTLRHSRGRLAGPVITAVGTAAPGCAAIAQ